MLKPLSLIVACAENRVIGRQGKLPWHIPEDLRWFHAHTAQHLCILGRICFETWPRATADGRRPIVVTKNHALAGPDVQVAASFGDALALADVLPGEVWVCGGERIYVEALAQAGRRLLRLYLTEVHAEVPGDTYMPEWRHLPWREVQRRSSQDAAWRYTFSILELPGPTTA